VLKSNGIIINNNIKKTGNMLGSNSLTNYSKPQYFEIPVFIAYCVKLTDIWSGLHLLPDSVDGDRNQLWPLIQLRSCLGNQFRGQTPAVLCHVSSFLLTSMTPWLAACFTTTTMYYSWTLICRSGRTQKNTST